MDSSFGNRDGLLLHSLMNGDLILDVHLVEFIDAAYSMVRQHECSSLDTELTSFWISANACSETSCITCSSTTVDSSGKELANVLQELTLSCCWITDYANVDISS